MSTMKSLRIGLFWGLLGVLHSSSLAGSIGASGNVSLQTSSSCVFYSGANLSSPQDIDLDMTPDIKAGILNQSVATASKSILLRCNRRTQARISGARVVLGSSSKTQSLPLTRTGALPQPSVNVNMLYSLIPAFVFNPSSAPATGTFYTLSISAGTQLRQDWFTVPSGLYQGDYSVQVDF